MTTHRVVFDCVVCAQPIINARGPAGACVELCRRGVLLLCLSDYLIDEIRQLPAKLSPRMRIDDARIERFLNDLGSFSIRIDAVPDVYHLARDPDDSHYIDLAIPAGADFRKRFSAVRILTPEQLLTEIPG